ncbi:MAG: ATP-binding protein [Gaiellaceae bacterium]
MNLLERDDALAALAEAHASAARGEGRVVVVSGEPGIGKSALVDAFRATLPLETQVLLGTCDDLTIPRPLGPFSDLIGHVSAALEDAVVAGAPPERFHPLLIAELDHRSHATVLVVEDVHWADDATLDAVRFLARRVAALHAMVVLTLRAGEAPDVHSLHAALGDVPAVNAVYLELAPLSEPAVAALAGDAAADVFTMTRGNPFYVIELLAARDEEAVPPSVAHAVVGRAARLGPDARRLVELVAVVPRRVRASLLDHAFAEWPYAAAEAERRQLLDVRPQYVAFRHELARAAILGSIPAATRRRLHADILAALLATGGDPSDVVHHAEAAGADAIVGDHVLLAARRAAAVESNREAYAHYHRALDFIDRYPPREQALLLEELTSAAHLVGRFDDAIAAVGRAIVIWRDIGDEFAVGRCTRMLSRLRWFVGDGTLARADATRAIAILAPFGDSAELATAYGMTARLAALAGDVEAARAWAERALATAASVGDTCSTVHAQVTLATVDVAMSPDAAPLVEAHNAALAAGLKQEAAVALGNLVHSLTDWGLPRIATPYLELALAEAKENEIHHHGSYANAMQAWLRLRAGNWDAAERTATAEVGKGISVSELVGQTVLAELAVRRGDGDAGRRLTALAERAERTREPHRLVPVLDLMVERSLTSEDAAAPVERLRTLVADPPVQAQLALRLAAAAAVAGLAVATEPAHGTPHDAVARKDWRAAADAFGAEGWSYDRALMLTLLDDADALTEALAIARTLGATPLAHRATRRLRELGHRVPRGPYRDARGNRAALTGRQLEVLALVVAGRTNAQIADELVVSPRTVEHHVAAVLAKLGATSRRDVAARAAALGLASSR